MDGSSSLRLSYFRSCSPFSLHPPSSCCIGLGHHLLLAALPLAITFLLPPSLFFSSTKFVFFCAGCWRAAGLERAAALQALKALSVLQLKAALKEMGLPTSGRKADLVQLLADADYRPPTPTPGAVYGQTLMPKKENMIRHHCMASTASKNCKVP